MNKLALLVGSSLVAGMAIAADQESAITQSTDLELTVPSGETRTYDKTITLTDGAKLVKKGAGTLVLSAGDNSFDGGIDLQQGTLQADAEGAFGMQKIMLSTTTSRLLVFNAANATFPNDIEQTAGYGTGWLVYSAKVLKSTVLSGTFTSCKDFKFQTSAALSITGDMTFTAGKLAFDLNGGNAELSGVVTCPVLQHEEDGWRSSGTAQTLTLSNPANQIGQIHYGGGVVKSAAEGALGGAELYANTRYNEQYLVYVNLAGKSQKSVALDFNPNYAVGSCPNSARIGTSGSAATLTVTGAVTAAGSNVAKARQLFENDLTLVVDAPDFTQIFSERVNTTKGSLMASNGVMRLEDTVSFASVPTVLVGPNGTFETALASGSALTGVRTLKVDGVLRVEDDTLFPFAQGSVALELGENAEVYLPADTAFTVASLKIGGVEKGAGLYNIDQIKSGAIVVPGGAATWTGEGGDDTAITLPANWGGALPDILFGSAALRFATGGSVASVGDAYQFGGVTLNAADGFTFAKADEDAAIKVNGTITVAKDAGDAEDVRRYDFEPPVTLKAAVSDLAQTFDVPANDTLAFSGGLDLTGSSATLTKTGAGTVEFGDGTVIERWIQHNAGEIRIKGTFATPGHIDQGGGGSWEWNPSFCLDATKGGGQTLVLDGVVFEKSFFGKSSGTLLSTVNNTTNVFKGNVLIQDPACKIAVNGPDGHLWLEGGFTGTWSITPVGGGTLHFCDCVTETLARTNVPYSVGVGTNTRIVFEGVLNLFDSHGGLYFSSENGIVEFKKSYALIRPLPLLYFGDQYGTGTKTNTLYLGSTTQQVAVIASNDARGAGRTRKEVITGDAGAALEVTSCGTNVVNWAGAVSLVKRGEGLLLMKYRDCSSTGDVTVLGGELAFADSSWRNGANVTVAGTGKLTVTQPDTFGRGIALALNDDGVISVAEGATVRAAKLTVDGVEIGPGRYTYATAPDALKVHLDPDAAGAVSVKGGFVLMVR